MLHLLLEIADRYSWGLRRLACGGAGRLALAQGWARGRRLPLRPRPPGAVSPRPSRRQAARGAERRRRRVCHAPAAGNVRGPGNGLRGRRLIRETEPRTQDKRACQGLGASVAKCTRSPITSQKRGGGKRGKFDCLVARLSPSIPPVGLIDNFQGREQSFMRGKPTGAAGNRLKTGPRQGRIICRV